MATTNDQAVINLGRLKTYDDLLKAEVAKDVSNLQKQVDSVKAIATSAIETYMHGGVPTTGNYPANEWTTDELKKQHLGDVYYDHDTGSAYRYMSDDSGYNWVAIPDSIATTAAAKADAALQAATYATTKATDAQTSADKSIKNVVSPSESGIAINIIGDSGNKSASISLAAKLNGGIRTDNNGAYVDTDVIATKASVDAKQDKLTAGNNVTISNNVISANDTVYSLPAATENTLGGVKVGANLSVAADGTLSANMQTTDISGKQDKLTAGHGIALDGATISAKPAAGSPIAVTAAGIDIADGTTTAKGAVQLSDVVNSTSTSLAATANAVKKAYDLAAGKQSALTFATDDDINAMFA